ncbi:FIST C-terminal domain-containing protein, partial [bacterium]|nr:FIST C-terminal domain-containing protein [bacterium]
MINKGFGISIHEDSFEAGSRAARRAKQQNSDPDICLVFASSEFEAKEVMNGIKSVVGDVLLFGSSSHVVISNAGIQEKAVEVLLLSGKGIEFDIFHHKCDEDGPEKTAEKVVKKYLQKHDVSSEDNISCIMLGTEEHFSGIKYIDGINKSFPFPLPVSGGGSIGKGDNFFHGYQYFDDNVYQDNLGMLFIKMKDKEKLKFCYSFESKWEPIAPAVKCTRTEGSFVLEVDELPVMTYMKMYLGENFKEALKHTSYKYTFIARLLDSGGDKYVIRTPIYDFENGTLSFFPNEDMHGVEIQLVQLNQDEMLRSASKSGKKVSEILGDYVPEVVFVFCCHIRNSLLHSRSGLEVEMLRQELGDKVPIVGMYCAGEYAPLYEKYDDVVNLKNSLCGSRQFSTSLTMMIIASRREKPDSVDYNKLLLSHINEDNKIIDEKTLLKNKLKKAEKLLQESENVIVETERAFKCINNEHYSLAMTLQQTNNSLVEANHKNERLQKIIRQYTPHNVWKKVHKTAEIGKFAIPDEELMTTLMFLDIKGFTAFSEKHPSWEVIEEINRIFEPVTTIIYQHSGDIDKFIGDCIFAVFETPADAVICSLAIHKFVEKIDTPFLIRIGINSGRVISGNVGARIRKDNTLIGDAVNLAQRLESKCTPGAILVSRDCFLDVPNELLDEKKIVKRSLTVKGKS